MADNLLDKASILLTPTAYDNGSMLSVKPENGDGDFTFSRAGNGSRVNSSGNIVTESANIPRIEYTDGCGVWLLEPQSTNLIPYSEDFSQWSIGGDIVIESGYLAPDGSSNAYKVSGSDNALKLTVVNLTGSSSRTIYAKTVSGTGTTCLFTHRNNTNNIFTITEDWQRFEINSSDSASSTDTFFAVDFRKGDLTELIVWGAQAEALPYATSYIPTNGAIATRLQDIANNSGNSTLINSTEGVLYAEMKPLAIYNLQRWLGISDGTNNNKAIIAFYNSSTDYRIACEVKSGGSTQAFMTYNLGAVEPTFIKVALKYKENDFALWVNGVEVATDTNGSAPIGLSKLNFNRGDGGQKFEGKAKALAVFPILTNAQIQSLTTQ